MKLTDYRRLAEARILEAQARGEFDDLPGSGRPLPPDALAGLPAEARAAARIHANLGSQPEEVRLQAEIRSLEATLALAGADAPALKRRLGDLRVRLEILHERAGRRLLANAGLTFVPG